MPGGRLAQWVLLAYVFTTFVVGTACVGAALVLLRRDDALVRAFLLFYLPLTVLVLAALLLALVDTLPASGAAVHPTLEYLEDIVGRYAVMLALPLFAHRVWSVRSRRREALLTALVLAALVGQHLTEYVLGGRWDERGDVAEDVLFAAIVLYTLWLAFAPRAASPAYPPLARRFRALLLLALPIVAYDVFLAEGSVLRFYPLWYCVLGVTMALTLVRRSAQDATIPPAWELSLREAEVVRLVQRGLSTEQIADRLTISPNTVKTHLRAIFDKSGFRTRAALIASLAAGNHPRG